MPRSPFRLGTWALIGLGTCLQVGMAMMLPPGLFLPGLWSSRAVAGSSFPGGPWVRTLLDVSYAWAALLAMLAAYRAFDWTGRMSTSLGGMLSGFATVGRRAS